MANQVKYKANYSDTINKYQKQLTKKATSAEKKLKQCFDKFGIKYQFQKIITVESGKKYIVDFYLSKYNLVIEVDGSSHINKEVEDNLRTYDIEQLGYKVIRITNSEVKQIKFEKILDILNDRFGKIILEIKSLSIENSLSEENKENIRIKQYKDKIAKLKEELSHFKRDTKRLKEENLKLKNWLEDYNTITI